MSKENVKKFFEEVSNSEDLKKQLNAAAKENEAAIAKAVKAQTEAVVSVAKGAGFDFTADELLAAGAPEGSKLDMNELDAVAGGWVGLTSCAFLGFGVGFGCDGGGSWCAIIGGGLGCTGGGM